MEMFQRALYMTRSNRVTGCTFPGSIALSNGHILVCVVLRSLLTSSLDPYSGIDSPWSHASYKAWRKQMK